MSQQVGLTGLLRTLRNEAPYWAGTLPQLPRLLHRALAEDRIGELRTSLDRLAVEQQRRNNLLAVIVLLLGALTAALALALVT
jgi:ubiquinone biosynthesis protein